MKNNHKIALITSGVILFIFSLICIISSIAFIFFNNLHERNTDPEEYFFCFIIIFIAIIILFYIKSTNFGIQKNELEKTREEKEKLKELIEINELKKKLTNLNNS